MKKCLLLTIFAALALGCGGDVTVVAESSPDTATDVAEDAGPDLGDTGADVDAALDPTTDEAPDLPDSNDVDDDAGEDTLEDTVPDAGPDAAEDAGPPDTPIEVRELSVLVIGPQIFQIPQMASAIDGVLDAHPGLDVTSADSIGYIMPGLLGFAYRWTDLDERLAPLSEDYDIVIVVDGFELSAQSPEAHFEGVRVLAEIVAASGGELVIAANGGDDAVSNTYRVGAGIGVPVLPVSRILDEARSTSADWDTALAAALLYALTGEDPLPYGEGSGTTESTWLRVADAARRVLDSASDTLQFDGAWAGAVRIEPRAIPETYYFMVTGTSSERGWEVQMSALLDREGIDYESVNLGQCNEFRSLDAACLVRAEEHFAENSFMSLYARAYDVTADQLRAAGGSELQSQVYDRHWDMPDNPGTIALDQIDDRVWSLSTDARAQGLAWLPQHINFARLKYALPDAQLLTDGVHATSAVQSGLAAMSFYSRTGIEPSVEGLDEETATAITLGVSTIRQLSVLSLSGEPVVDDPATRPSLR